MTDQVDLAALGADDEVMACHQAEAVAAAGLAVIELPERTKESRHLQLFSGLSGNDNGIQIGAFGPISPDDVRAFAAALLAAANAAEAVSR